MTASATSTGASEIAGAMLNGIAMPSDELSMRRKRHSIPINLRPTALDVGVSTLGSGAQWDFLDELRSMPTELLGANLHKFGRLTCRANPNF
jgi:hypothetical protein